MDSETSNRPGREEEMSFRRLERERIASKYHDTVVPEVVAATYQLHIIQKDLEAQNSPQSVGIHEAADRIIAAVNLFWDTLNPEN